MEIVEIIWANLAIYKLKASTYGHDIIMVSTVDYKRILLLHKMQTELGLRAQIGPTLVGRPHLCPHLIWVRPGEDISKLAPLPAAAAPTTLGVIIQVKTTKGVMCQK